MKTRLIVTAFLICSLLGATAIGQKRSIRLFELQDDETGSHFTFDSTGNYLYVGCKEEIKLDGVGNVKITGCTVTLESLTRTSQVQAEVDLCKRSGGASILLDGPCALGNDCEPKHFTVVDSNSSNNTAECK